MNTSVAMPSLDGCACTLCEFARGKMKLGRMAKLETIRTRGIWDWLKGLTLQDNPMATEEYQKAWAEGFLGAEKARKARAVFNFLDGDLE